MNENEAEKEMSILRRINEKNAIKIQSEKP